MARSQGHPGFGGRSLPPYGSHRGGFPVRALSHSTPFDIPLTRKGLAMPEIGNAATESRVGPYGHPTGSHSLRPPCTRKGSPL
ncbi:hypothetical protein ACVWXU_007651 [Streptomyces sp. TE33382]